MRAESESNHSNLRFESTPSSMVNKVPFLDLVVVVVVVVVVSC